MRIVLLFLTFLLAGPLQANPFDVKPDFLPVNQAFVLTHDRQAYLQMRLFFQIKQGYYLYQKRLKFDGLPPDQQPQLPPALNHHDEFFGDSAVYRDQLELLIPANAQGQLRLGWQGCADAGLCYPPQTTAIDLGGRVTPAAEQASDQALASGLQSASLAWSLLAFFGLGLLLAFTPCSLPMLPILAGLVLGNGASARRGWLLAGVCWAPACRRGCSNPGCWAAWPACSSSSPCRCSAPSSYSCRQPCAIAWTAPAKAPAAATCTVQRCSARCPACCSARA